jgi:hypothetical protein
MFPITKLSNFPIAVVIEGKATGDNKGRIRRDFRLNQAATPGILQRRRVVHPDSNQITA